MATIVHIVAPDQATKSGPKTGLCGGKVEGLYVRQREGLRNSPGALCVKCVAASAKLGGARPAKDPAKDDDRELP